MIPMNYLPWRTTALDEFAAYIRTVIGSSVNIGIVIMGVILAVLIIIRIAKKFAK